MLGLGLNFGSSESGSSAARMGGPGLLLDTYGSAAAAYSLRKLNSSYTGKVVQLRRGSDHVEVDVGFDADGLLSLDSPVTNVVEESTGITQGSSTNAAKLGEFCGEARRDGGDGSYATVDSMEEASHVEIVTWYDQSGNANNATQAAAANQPRIYDRSSGLVTENGKPAVENVLSGKQGLNIPSFTINLSDFTCTLVSKFYSDSHSQGRPVLMNADTGQGLDYRYKQFWIARNAFYLGTSSVRSVDNAVNYTSSTNLQLHTITPTNGYVDGTSAGTFGTAGEDLNLNPTFNYLTSGDIGRDRGTHANTCEVIIWTTDESDNRTGIESNINTFYSIY